MGTPKDKIPPPPDILDRLFTPPDAANWTKRQKGWVRKYKGLGEEGEWVYEPTGPTPGDELNIGKLLGRSYGFVENILPDPVRKYLNVLTPEEGLRRELPRPGETRSQQQARIDEELYQAKQGAETLSKDYPSAFIKYAPESVKKTLRPTTLERESPLGTVTNFARESYLAYGLEEPLSVLDPFQIVGAAIPGPLNFGRGYRNLSLGKQISKIIDDFPDEYQASSLLTTPPSPITAEYAKGLIKLHKSGFDLGKLEDATGLDWNPGGMAGFISSKGPNGEFINIHIGATDQAWLGIYGSNVKSLFSGYVNDINDVIDNLNRQGIRTKVPSILKQAFQQAPTPTDPLAEAQEAIVVPSNVPTPSPAPVDLEGQKVHIYKFKAVTTPPTNPAAFPVQPSLPSGLPLANTVQFGPEGNVSSYQVSGYGAVTPSMNLNEVKLTSWTDAPVPPKKEYGEQDTQEEIIKWMNVEGVNLSIDEPTFDVPHGKKGGSGVIIVEPDGRVWIMEPTGHFGGTHHTFPKGTKGNYLNLQENAIKEAFEETGLKVEIIGHFADIEHGTATIRYYIAKRVGGTPLDKGWEAHSVKLIPAEYLPLYFNKNKNLAETVQIEIPTLVDQIKKSGQPISNLLESEQAQETFVYEYAESKAVDELIQKSPKEQIEDLLAHAVHLTATSPEQSIAISKLALDLYKLSKQAGDDADTFVNNLNNYHIHYKSQGTPLNLGQMGYLTELYNSNIDPGELEKITGGKWSLNTFGVFEHYTPSGNKDANVTFFNNKFTVQTKAPDGSWNTKYFYGPEEVYDEIKNTISAPTVAQPTSQPPTQISTLKQIDQILQSHSVDAAVVALREAPGIRTHTGGKLKKEQVQGLLKLSQLIGGLGRLEDLMPELKWRLALSSGMLIADPVGGGIGTIMIDALGNEPHLYVTGTTSNPIISQDFTDLKEAADLLYQYGLITQPPPDIPPVAPTITPTPTVPTVLQGNDPTVISNNIKQLFMDLKLQGSPSGELAHDVEDYLNSLNIPLWSPQVRVSFRKLYNSGLDIDILEGITGGDWQFSIPLGAEISYYIPNSNKRIFIVSVPNTVSELMVVFYNTDNPNISYTKVGSLNATYDEVSNIITQHQPPLGTTTPSTSQPTTLSMGKKITDVIQHHQGYPDDAVAELTNNPDFTAEHGGLIKPDVAQQLVDDFYNKGVSLSEFEDLTGSPWELTPFPHLYKTKLPDGHSFYIHTGYGTIMAMGYENSAGLFSETFQSVGEAIHYVKGYISSIPGQVTQPPTPPTIGTPSSTTTPTTLSPIDNPNSTAKKITSYISFADNEGEAKDMLLNSNIVDNNGNPLSDYAAESLINIHNEGLIAHDLEYYTNLEWIPAFHGNALVSKQGDKEYWVNHFDNKFWLTIQKPGLGISDQKDFNSLTVLSNYLNQQLLHAATISQPTTQYTSAQTISDLIDQGLSTSAIIDELNNQDITDFDDAYLSHYQINKQKQNQSKGLSIGKLQDEIPGVEWKVGHLGNIAGEYSTEQFNIGMIGNKFFVGTYDVGTGDVVVDNKHFDTFDDLTSFIKSHLNTIVSPQAMTAATTPSTTPYTPYTPTTPPTPVTPAAQIVQRLSTVIAPTTPIAINPVPSTPRLQTNVVEGKISEIINNKTLGNQTNVGSNKGGWTKGAVGGPYAGKDIYAKFEAYKAPGEHLANTIYRAYGASQGGYPDAPETFLFKDENGDIGFGSIKLQGYQEVKSISNDLTKNAARQWLRNAHLDMLLMNWDAIGLYSTANILYNPTSDRIIRVDQGGSLLYRAEGEPRTQSQLYNLTEWDYYPTQNPKYKQMMQKAEYETFDEMGKDLFDNIMGLPDDWTTFVNSQLPPWIGSGNAELIDILNHRTRLLKERATEIPRNYFINKAMKNKVVNGQPWIDPNWPEWQQALKVDVHSSDKDDFYKAIYIKQILRVPGEPGEDPLNAIKGWYSATTRVKGAMANLLKWSGWRHSTNPDPNTLNGAKEIINAIYRETKTTPPLWRGVTAPDPADPEDVARLNLLKAARVGDVINYMYAPFSWSENTAIAWAGSGIVIELPEPSKALRIEHVSVHNEQEWITGGYFEILNIRQAHGKKYYTVRQLNTYFIP